MKQIKKLVTLCFRVEDHDDLVPIFNRQSEALSETYGDYFLAELIEATDENMKCIVAEVGLLFCCQHSIIQTVNKRYRVTLI